MKWILPIAAFITVAVLDAQNSRVYGRITDSAGVPLQGARVTILGTEGTRAGRSTAVVSDSEGHYSAPLSDQRILLIVEAPGYIEARRFVTANDAAVEQTFALSAGTEISGMVVDRSNRPVSADIHVFQVGRAIVGRSTRANSLGAFSLGGLERTA